MIITAQRKQCLLQSGISTHLPDGFLLPDDTVFEPPCSLKWMRAEWSLRLSAFSYAVSGYYFGAQIGRYTSIGEDVQLGRGSHPITWASTSPAFYEPHQYVFDHSIPEAAEFKINAPYLPPRHTVIGNDVYIGHGAFLRSGVRVGDGAVVAACSVVTKDVPPYAVVAGVPATIKKMRHTEAVIERMQRTCWWDYAFWDLSGAPVSRPDEFPRLRRGEDCRRREKIRAKKDSPRRFRGRRVRMRHKLVQATAELPYNQEVYSRSQGIDRAGQSERFLRWWGWANQHGIEQPSIFCLSCRWKHGSSLSPLRLGSLHRRPGHRAWTKSATCLHGPTRSSLELLVQRLAVAMTLTGRIIDIEPACSLTPRKR